MRVCVLRRDEQAKLIKAAAEAGVDKERLERELAAADEFGLFLSWATCSVSRSVSVYVCLSHSICLLNAVSLPELGRLNATELVDAVRVKDLDKHLHPDDPTTL